MKILVLNGSPKEEESNTYKLTKSFIEGLNQNQQHTIELINIASKKIQHCIGCFNCWTKTPGKCIIEDDMESLIAKYLDSDLVIWSVPLYYYGLPSKAKAFLDRLLPINLPFIDTSYDGTNTHPKRYDVSHQKYVLISTCGFYSKENNYEALSKQFDILYGDKCTKLFCPEGELFKVEALQNRTKKYLEYVKKAGEEYIISGKFDEKTQKNLDELLFEPDVFVKMADASWQISSNNKEQDQKNNILGFLKQMAAIYNKSAYKKKDSTILEFYFTDFGETFQLEFDKNNCQLLQDNKKYSTRIEVDFELWKKISDGKLDGQQAFFDKKYKILGDFDTILKIEEYFLSNKDKDSKPERKSNILFFVLPWILFLFYIKNMQDPFGVVIYSFLMVLAAILIPSIASLKNKLVIWDVISLCIIGSFPIFYMSTRDCLTIYHEVIFKPSRIQNVWYFMLGIMFLSAVYTKIPLTAYYSCNSYGGQKAFKNPLFIQTNKILSICWGFVYILQSIVYSILMESSYNNYNKYNNIANIVSICIMILMGIFSFWFSRWYPAAHDKNYK